MAPMLETIPAVIYLAIYLALEFVNVGRVYFIGYKS